MSPTASSLTRRNARPRCFPFESAPICRRLTNIAPSTWKAPRKAGWRAHRTRSAIRWSSGFRLWRSPSSDGCCYSWQHKDAKLMTAADKEEFNTQQYPGPGLPAERPNLDLGRMTVPPPPPPPAEPQVPPPPVAPPTALAAPPFPDAATQKSDEDEKGGWPKRSARSGSAFGRASSLRTAAPPWRRAAPMPRRTRTAPAAERRRPRKTAIVAFWRRPARPDSKNPSRPRTIASTRSSRRER